MPQMESKGAAVMLAFMAGTMAGLSDKDPTLAFVALVLVVLAVWQFRLKERP